MSDSSRIPPPPPWARTPRSPQSSCSHPDEALYGVHADCGYTMAYLIRCADCDRYLHGWFATYADDYTIPAVEYDQKWCCSHRDLISGWRSSGRLPVREVEWSDEITRLAPPYEKI